jgi:hypothetical protein
MRSGKLFGFSAVEKNKIWSCWKVGQSLHEIGRAFDKPHSSIRCLLLPRGGIPPATRRRSQSPWQRGTNENTNLLLRQYFPRGTDLSGYSQEQLDQVSLLLNQRPRKTLGFQTPADKLQASVASTV